MFTIFLIRFSKISVSWNIGLKEQGYKMGRSFVGMHEYLFVKRRATVGFRFLLNAPPSGFFYFIYGIFLGA
jgi:hypothetical protein